MIDKKIIEAIEEAERFIMKSRQYLLANESKQQTWSMIPKESGALKRSSMDLTRALAELRK